MGRLFIGLVIWFGPGYLLKPFNSGSAHSANSYVQEGILLQFLPNYLLAILLFGVSKPLMAKLKLVNTASPKL